jgi:two-component system chemotaxis response regulator CheB
MKRIRAVVIEDSPTMRAHLRETLSADPQIEVVGEAEEGGGGIALCERLRPDVITLDMAMPRIDGLAVTRHVMAHCAAPILIVSASTERGEAFSTFDALRAGAVEVLEKARGDEAEGEWEKRFVATVKLVSRIKVITRPPPRPGMAGPMADWEVAVPRRRPCELVAIGASTGGPAALLHVLRAVPPQTRVPVLVVLHIGASFAPAFVDWLGSQLPHKVCFARHGAALAALGGQIVMAPADRHLLVRGGQIVLGADGERHSCRPSVDVLFESVAASCGAAAAGCLLTGMGRDGAAGLRQIREAGGRTLAQDEASSVVYGMPREAALLGAAERILPLPEIGPALAAIMERGL